MGSRNNRRISQSSSLPNVRRAQSAGSLGRSTRSSFAGDNTFEARPTPKRAPTPGKYIRPWAQGTVRRPASRVGEGSAHGSGSLVETLKQRLAECGASRRNMTQALAEMGAFDGSKCSFVDFENMLKVYGVRLSYMEILYLRRQFSGDGVTIDFQKFTNSFYNSKSGSFGQASLATSPLYVHSPLQLESALSKKLQE
eukprot:SAG31_NODE_9712_length_1238_cov_1.435470_2_plen_196_part_01